MFEKQKITDILPAKSGIGKNGKPYTFYKIKTDREGDKILTTFGNATTEKWKVGDEIEIKVTETKSADGKYTNYNFEIPKKNDQALEKVIALEITVDQLKRAIKPLLDEFEKREDTKTRGYEYPTEQAEPNFDQEVEDLTKNIPF